MPDDRIRHLTPARASTKIVRGCALCNRLLGCADDRIRAVSRARDTEASMRQQESLRTGPPRPFPCISEQSRAPAQTSHNHRQCLQNRQDDEVHIAKRRRCPLKRLDRAHIRIEIVPLAKAHCNAPWCANNAWCCGWSLKTCASLI